MAKGKPIFAALMAVQADLKAPKNQRNNFGKYNYRSCEDIVEAVKPLLKENGLFLTMSDDIVQIGDRYYVKATVSVTDIVTGESVQTSALARESAQKKGMDESQVTGTASSYARKYALNGLLAIDDAKDADTDDYARHAGTTIHIGQPQNDAEWEIQDARHRMAAEVKLLAATGDELKTVCQNHFGKTNSKALNIEELNLLTEKMKDWISAECKNM